MAAPVASCMGNGINKGDTVEVSTGQYLGVYENYMLGSFDMWLFMGTDYVASDDPVNNPLGFTFVTHLATERVDDVQVVKTYTYNLQGQMVQDDVTGIVIKVDLMSDGTQKAYKTINK